MMFFLCFFSIILMNIARVDAQHLPNYNNKTDLTEVSSLPQSRELLINELLFNPYPSAPNFIELINVSDRELNMKNVLVGTRKPDGSLWQVLPIAKQNVFLEPNGIIVLCENPDTLACIYFQSCVHNFWLFDTPRMNNDEGCVVVMNADSVILDELTYTESTHHFLFKDLNGVSLERISVDLPTQDKQNWASATSNVGFATPGCANSASQLRDESLPELTFSTAMVSPNGDGYQDALTISLNSSSDWIVTMRVFASSGQLVDVESNVISPSFVRMGRSFQSWSFSSHRDVCALFGVVE